MTCLRNHYESCEKSNWNQAHYLVIPRVVIKGIMFVGRNMVHFVLITVDVEDLELMSPAGITVSEIPHIDGNHSCDLVLHSTKLGDLQETCQNNWCTDDVIIRVIFFRLQKAHQSLRGHYTAVLQANLDSPCWINWILYVLESVKVSYTEFSDDS